MGPWECDPFRDVGFDQSFLSFRFRWVASVASVASIVWRDDGRRRRAAGGDLKDYCLGFTIESVRKCSCCCLNLISKCKALLLMHPSLLEIHILRALTP